MYSPHDAAGPKLRAVLAHVPALVLGSALLRCLLQYLLGYTPPPILGCEEEVVLRTDDLLFGVAEDSLGTCVPVSNAPTRVHHEYRVVLHAFHKQAVAFLTLPKVDEGGLELGCALFYLVLEFLIETPDLFLHPLS